jgi:hypothetical protein
MSTQKNTQEKPRGEQTQSDAAVSNEEVVWVRVSPPQVVRTVIIALSTVAAVLGALYLLWHVRSFLGWFVIALFLAAVLNPVVNWLQRRHKLIKRGLAIVLTYLVHDQAAFSAMDRCS